MPAPVLQVSDVDTLRAISDPTRMRLLERMVTRQDPPWSVKELASALEVPQTRLYHHMELLAGRGLIRAVEQRVVSGIIETRYRAAARSFQLDRQLFAGGEDPAGEYLHEALAAVFDRARDEVAAAVASDNADLSAEAPAHRQILLARAIARLSPARAEAFRRRLQELEAEFDIEDDAEAQAYGLVVALYPLSGVEGA
jgi:DNA-binding transcriptional ArsR family regulator